LAPESYRERSLARTDLTYLPASALAELIARGEVSAMDAVRPISSGSST
jgi:hypothetical protein